MSTHRPFRVFMILGFCVASLFVTAGEAQACSCAGIEPRDAIAQYDASFVGTVLEGGGGGVIDGVFGDDGTFRFAVETDVKGNLGSEVEVYSPGAGGACGLEVDEGDRVGLFLTLNADDVWTSSLCSQIAPDVLLRAAAPLPAPDGTGPIRFLLGGNFGEARLMSVDGRGRTLAYGYGQGEVFDIDVCPGGGRSVETVVDGRIGSLVVRDVRSLEILREVRLVDARNPFIYVVACLDRRAEHLLAIDDGVRVHEIVGDESSVVFSSPGRAWGSTIEGDEPHLTLRGRRFGRLDVRSGRFQTLVRLPEDTTGPRLSPDGRWVAWVRYGGGRPGEPPSDIVLLSTRDGSIRTQPLVFWNDSGWIQWLSANRFLFLPTGEDVDRIAIYDVPSLEEVVGADEWYAGEAVITDGVVYGTNGYQLSRVRLGTDEVTTVFREFDGPVYALAHVPGRANAEPSPPPPTTATTPVTGPPVSGRGLRLGVVLAAALAVAAGVAFGLFRRGRGSEPIEV